MTSSFVLLLLEELYERAVVEGTDEVLHAVHTLLGTNQFVVAELGELCP